tara:strand:- start:347 stop:625 length:279 start_codon:yes stop_codon:yes gene_type:complete
MHGSKDPLHGLTLEDIITALEQRYGWSELGKQIKIRCFTHDPSISSSLKFLRKTPWARKKVETLYLHTQWPEKNVWLEAQDTLKNKSDKTQD